MTPEESNAEYERLTEAIRDLYKQRDALPDVAEAWKEHDWGFGRPDLRSNQFCATVTPCGTKKWSAYAGLRDGLDKRRFKTPQEAMKAADKVLKCQGVLLKGGVPE